MPPESQALRTTSRPRSERLRRLERNGVASLVTRVPELGNTTLCTSEDAAAMSSAESPNVSGWGGPPVVEGIRSEAVAVAPAPANRRPPSE